MAEDINRAELLERARKLFAKTPDKGSLEDAAIAARKLRKLMDDNAIRLSELNEIRPCCLHKDSSERYGKRSIPA